MPIGVKCTGCGKAYRAPDEAAGKKLKCKECGELFAVPKPKPTVNDDDDDLPPVRSAKPAPLPAAAKLGGGTKESGGAKKRTKSAKSSSNIGTLVGGIAIGVVTIGAVMGILHYRFGRTPAPSAVAIAGAESTDSSAGSTAAPVAGTSSDQTNSANAGGTGASPDAPPKLPGWVTFQHPTGLFTVNMPSMPVAKKKPDYVTYLSMTMDYGTNAYLIDNGGKGTVEANSNAAMEMMRKQGYSCTESTFEGFPLISGKVEIKGGINETRVVVTPAGTCVVEFITVATDADQKPAEREHFFSSFRLMAAAREKPKPTAPPDPTSMATSTGPGTQPKADPSAPAAPPPGWVTFQHPSGWLTAAMPLSPTLKQKEGLDVFVAQTDEILTQVSVVDMSGPDFDYDPQTTIPTYVAGMRAQQLKVTTRKRPEYTIVDAEGMKAGFAAKSRTYFLPKGLVVLEVFSKKADPAGGKPFFDSLQLTPAGLGKPTPIPDPEPAELFDLASVPVPKFPQLKPTARAKTGATIFEGSFADANRKSDLPGSKMTIRVYRPAGNTQPKSRTCVLVSPTGTNMLVGSGMNDNHAEMEPYLPLGIVVVHFSLDGEVADLQNMTDPELGRAYAAFRSSMAGLINMRNAFEFILEKVPEVDPRKIFVAGHSSGGSAALLFAAHEPRLAGCLAYCPCVDVERFVRPYFVQHELLPDVEKFAAQSSPLAHRTNIKVPVFLFGVKDDDVSPLSRLTAFRQKLEAEGAKAELGTAASGGHYQPMISQGIPRGVGWIAKTAAAIQ